jgi:hypothetical protein
MVRAFGVLEFRTITLPSPLAAKGPLSHFHTWSFNLVVYLDIVVNSRGSFDLRYLLMHARVKCNRECRFLPSRQNATLLLCLVSMAPA